MYRFILLTLFVGLCSGIISACSDSPNDPNTEMIEKTITPTDKNETIDSATLYDDNSGETLGTGETTLEREKGAVLSVRAEADGFIPTTKTVSFESESNVWIALSDDEVTIDYRITDMNDELISSAELFIADTLAAETSDGSITLPYRETAVELCSQAEFHEDACEQIVPDQDHEVVFRNVRKTTTYTITPEIEGYDDELSNDFPNANADPDKAFYVLRVGDSTWVDAGDDVDTGEIENTSTDIGTIQEKATVSVPYPTGHGDVEVYIRAGYFPEIGHENSASGNYYLNIAEKTVSVSRGSDAKLDISLAHIPACSDGVNNDFTDGADKADPGCVDNEGNYDPEDDVELLLVGGHQYGSTPTDTTRISGAEGKREVLELSGWKLDPIFQIAMNIYAQINVMVSENQTGEEFGLKFAVGPNEDNLTDINYTSINEDNGTNGWKEVEFDDITKKWFKEGLSYEVSAIHATKIRNEPPTNGKDDVILSVPSNGETVWGFSIFAVFEPEDLQEAEKSYRNKMIDKRRINTFVKDLIKEK